MLMKDQKKNNRIADFPDEIVKAPDVYRPGKESTEHQFGLLVKLLNNYFTTKFEK